MYVFVVIYVSCTGEWGYEVLWLLDFRRLCFIAYEINTGVEVEGLITVRQNRPYA